MFLVDVIAYTNTTDIITAERQADVEKIALKIAFSVLRMRIMRTEK